ncbi:MAG: winged helix-turn-helix domain-containing protein [Anaerolineales bacterium]
MQPKFNVWLEKKSKVVLSLWRVQLLETIAETGSISAAAEKLGVPYRRCWEKVQEIEHSLGAKVIETAVGGSGGGGAQLTRARPRAGEQFQAIYDGLDDEIERRYRAVFKA